MARRQGAHGGPLVADAGQAGQVLVQVAVGRSDHHGRAVHDVVPGQEEGVLVDQPAQMVRGMPGRVQRPQRQARGAVPARAREHPPLPHALVGVEAVGGAVTDDAGAGRLGQRCRAGRVVDVGVRDHNGADRPQRSGGSDDGCGVGRIGRPGVDHDRPRVTKRTGAADEIRVGPRPGHETRVGSGQAQDAGCHLVEATRHRSRPDAEVRHRRDHGSPGGEPSGRGPGAASGPSSLARRETSRTASLKSPRALPLSGSGTAPRS